MSQPERARPAGTRFVPIHANTRTIHRPVGPVAYDCVKLIVVRDGSAILFSEFGERPINVGDVVLLAANTLCGSEPEGHITVSTIYADADYVLDQLFWQHADLLCDRLDTQALADTIYTEPAQILRLGEGRAGMLMPWVDELVALTADGIARHRFHRAQALGSAEGRSYRCQAAMRSCLRSLYTSRAMNRFRHRSTSFLESPSASLRCM